MKGTRRPSSACWPSAQLICDWFTLLPFAPVVTISAKELRGKDTSCRGRHALSSSELNGASAPLILPSSLAPREAGSSARYASSSGGSGAPASALTPPSSSSSRMVLSPTRLLSSMIARRCASPSLVSRRSSMPHV